MSNLYIPRKNGTTTEIDLLMIAKTGIYVFESKNYSGWIFGDEKYKDWTQTLENRRKQKFFNPIWQNEAHINALKYVLPQKVDEQLYKSMIVFSERCTLKKIKFTSTHVEVLKRNDLVKWMKKDIAHAPRLLSDFEMNKLYYTLKKYACVDDSVKQAHVESLKVRKIK